MLHTKPIILSYNNFLEELPKDSLLDDGYLSFNFEKSYHQMHFLEFSTIEVSDASNKVGDNDTFVLRK